MDVHSFALSEGSLRSKPVLVEGAIHVWTVRLDSSDVADDDVLSPAERTRAAGFKVEIARARFVARRAALRRILSAYTDESPVSIAFTTNDYGKPALLCDSTLSFSASHSESLALIAVARRALLGIDVECVREANADQSVAARFFTRSEAASLAQMAAGDRVKCFFNVWTRKEAIVKALGCGLSIPLDSFEVTLRSDMPAAITRWHVAGAEHANLRLCHLEPAAGYVGALAFGPADGNA